MARRVFFSFHYDRDAWRVAKVRNSAVIGNYEKPPFYDKAQWESIKRQGTPAIRSWIDSQLRGTSVTIVLIGAQTAQRRWVKYEIEESIKRGNGLLGIDISKILDRELHTDTTGANPLPSGYPLYKWNQQDGGKNLAAWIELAAKQAGR